MQEQFRFPRLIKKVDGNNIPPPTEEQRLIYDAYARELQKKDPLSKKIGRGTVEGLMGVIQGMFGLDDGTSPLSIDNAGDVGKGLGSIFTAGLPFHAITKGKPVFHGTGKVFQRFNPAKYDKGDTLGAFTHFAENPEYAGKYATSDMKIERGNNPNIIPAYIDSKNTLDLTERNSVTGEDVSAILAALEDSYTKSIIKRVYQSKLRNPDDININPNKTIENFLSVEPKVLEKTPFDAIRYRDSDNDKSIAWAVPDRTTITTPWGTDISPIRNRESIVKGKIDSKYKYIDQSIDKMEGNLSGVVLPWETREFDTLFPHISINAPIEKMPLDVINWVRNKAIEMNRNGKLDKLNLDVILSHVKK